MGGTGGNGGKGGAKAAAGSGSKPGSQEQGSGMRAMGFSVGTTETHLPSRGNGSPSGWMDGPPHARTHGRVALVPREAAINQSVRCRCAAGIGLQAEREGAWKAGIDRGADASRG
ncbi:MAG: hypothetical protein AMXMBFR78_30130 [Rubrivivax sp.]